MYSLARLPNSNSLPNAEARGNASDGRPRVNGPLSCCSAPPSPHVLSTFFSIARGRSSLKVSKSFKTQHQTTVDSQVVNVERKEKRCVGS